MAMELSRRQVLGRGAAFSMAFAGLHAVLAAERSVAGLLRHTGTDAGYGPLLLDPARVLDLPEGFSYTVISRAGDPMDDGLVTPGQPDGMATFPGPNGKTLLVRNHELEASWLVKSPFGSANERLGAVDATRIYDRGFGTLPSLGGTTTLVYDPATRRVERCWMSLAGTNRNCAGGPTPWGSWLSCEEDVSTPDAQTEKLHGYVFEVPASAEMGLADPHPIREMGRFMHEAVAVDPATGIVYLTEDRGDGLLYRFLPADRSGRLGSLSKGGRLQALAIKGADGFDTRNRKQTAVAVGSRLPVRWFDVDPEAPKDEMRSREHANGAALFARGEGMWQGRDGVYFVCTEGGVASTGQLWRYRPSAAEGKPGEEEAPGLLELFVEPNDPDVLQSPDNLTAAPWGDLILCEDSIFKDRKVQHLAGVTPEGRVYRLARNAKSSSEFAGVTFSPDGSTLFVNLQGDGLTLAINGPWRRA